MTDSRTPEPQPVDPGTAANAAAPAAAAPPTGLEGWTANSIFDRKDERKLGRAMSSSLIGHALLLAFFAWLGYRAVEQAQEAPKEKIDIVYLQQPGPGGGGGGSPKPAAPAKMEIPHPKPVEPVPVQPPPVATPPPPDPTLNAPIMTNMANLMQANGQGAVSLAAFGGGGSGGGIGSGRGDGVGPGTGGGFGGGAFRPGNGCSIPQPIRQVEPKYTSEAMRAKLQGDVEIEAVVQKDGRVGDVRLQKSLDRTFGLDEEALKAAKGWIFRPATCKGEPVDMIVTLALEFRLH
jgi:TonB family protein